MFFVKHFDHIREQNFPLQPEEVRRALAHHTNNFGVTIEDVSDLEEDNLSFL